VEHVHHIFVSGYAQSRGDQIDIQQVGCLFPLFLALYHFLSFFLGFRRPNLITGLSGRRTYD